MVVGVVQRLVAHARTTAFGLICCLIARCERGQLTERQRSGTLRIASTTLAAYFTALRLSPSSSLGQLATPHLQRQTACATAAFTLHRTESGVCCRCTAVKSVTCCDAMPRPSPPSTAPTAAKRRRPQTTGRINGSSVRDQRSFPAFATTPLDQHQSLEEQAQSAEEEKDDDDGTSEPFPELADNSSAEEEEEEEEEDDENDEDDDGSSAGEESDESSASAASPTGDVGRTAPRSRRPLSVSAAPPSFNDDSDTGASGSMRLLSLPSRTAPSLALESDSSGDENETGHELRYKNRIGAVPLDWYRDDTHIGYDAAGRRIVRKQQADAIDAFLARVSADSRHTVYDAVNDEHVTLTADELASLQRIRRGGYAHMAFDPYADYDHESFTSVVRHEAIGNPQEPKRRFIPSAWEAKRVVKLVRAMRNGWLRSIEESQAARAKKREQQQAAFLMWGSDGQLLSERGEERTGLHRMPPAIPPPKLALPGHAHSYNPPSEYLMSAAEEEQWRQQDPSDRPLDFIPRRYAAMRLIPAYADYVKERFERCQCTQCTRNATLTSAAIRTHQPLTCISHCAHCSLIVPLRPRPLSLSSCEAPQAAD